MGSTSGPGATRTATAAALRDIEAVLARAEASLRQVDPLVLAAEAAENHTVAMTRGRLARADSTVLHERYAALRSRFEQARQAFRASTATIEPVTDRVAAAIERLHDVRDHASLAAAVAATTLSAVPAARTCSVVTSGGSWHAGTGAHELAAILEGLPITEPSFLVLPDVTVDHRLGAAAGVTAGLIRVTQAHGAPVPGVLVLGFERPDAFDADDVAVARLLAAQAVLLDHVLRPEPVPAAGSSAVARALAHIEEHADSALDLDEIAAVAGVGPRRLQQVFQAELGTTPLRHLRRVRLERAHHDLRRADVADGTTVAEVAARHRFAHAGRFSADYRRVFGTTPRQTLLTGPTDAV